ncbi:hypothetical protein EJ419_01830 [Alloscardovia theropitheci]|uniref:Uncharacterized protein n=1 Tax=Alloscardovia theropitheci TaxID=2496842 RepID=A0A4R0QTJ7_9BIFI|nr:hypothetical protein [Alloscardovia theropitheci]TCD54858.1 hypothetical protein EJ419_01830 [Alloscardovia theropitheci]
MIANNDYALFRLWIPLVLMVTLLAMIIVHRKNRLKYLYILNFLCFTLSVNVEILLRLDVIDFKSVDSRVALLMAGTVLILMFISYPMTLVSLSLFLVELSKRHTWAKVMVGLGIVLLGLGLAGITLYGLFIFFGAMYSLKFG